MKTEIMTVRVQTLMLTEVEASWLKGVMQNPIWVENPEEEDSFDRDMRKSFFDALQWTGTK